MFNNIISDIIQFILVMSQTDAVMTQLTTIKTQISNFPLKCRLFLNLLLSNTVSSHEIQIPKNFKKNFEPFLQIFKKFSPEQKAYLIRELTEHVQTFLKGAASEAKNAIKEIECSCQMKLGMLGFSFWQRRNFKYSCQQSFIKLFTSKKEDVVDLRHYLIRKSQSQRNAVVLEPVNSQALQKLSKITLRFNNSSIMSEIYMNVRTAMVQLEQKKMERLFHQEIKQKSIECLNISNKSNNCFTILTKKTMTQYFNSKEKDLERLNYHRNQATFIYNNNNVQILRSRENKRYFFLEQTLEGTNINSIKPKIMILNEGVKQKNYSCEILQSFTANILTNYYKIFIDRQEYQFIVIVQKIQREDQFRQIIKGINNLSLGISIQFGLLVLRKTAKNAYSLQLNVQLNFHSQKKGTNSLKAVNLLKQMVKESWKQESINNTFCIDGRETQQTDIKHTKRLDYSLRDTQIYAINGHESNLESSDSKSISIQQSSDENKNSVEDQIFVTITNFQDDQDICVQSFEDKLKVNTSGNNGISSSSQVNQNKNNVQDNNREKIFLKAKSFDKPQEKGGLKKIKQHFLFGDWQRSSKGGVVCANQEIINKQKKVIRLLVSRLGNSIFNGNGIMNVSLPIDIFKSESQLVSIARNFTYAPLLIQPTVNLNALQRMKKAILFQISIGALSLSTQKPFNPILGQTYQGDIDGCPIFLEQISHHPPISNVFMVGRGYKIYGSICVDIHLRINHVKGITNKSLTVQYQNGDKIQFNSPVMMINGLLIGERSIYFDGQVYFTDEKNLIITSLLYNPNSKKGIFSFKIESPDYLAGEIYRVSHSFMQKFLASNKTLSPKKDPNNKVIATIHGEWNGKIFVNDQLAYNFQEDLPVQLQNCSYPLPSDSTLRKDILRLSKGERDLAQQEKDQLQLEQRREKKLRSEYKDSKIKK